MDNEINLLAIYEPKIDKTKLAVKIKQTLELYSNATAKDKEDMAMKLIVYSKTLEEGARIGFSGMTELFDDKCDLEEELIETKKKLSKALEFIKREHSSNPKIMEEFNNMNTVFVSSRGKRNYNDMIDQYVLKSKNLK
jgi:hypothetical protein